MNTLTQIDESLEQAKKGVHSAISLIRTAAPAVASELAVVQELEKLLVLVDKLRHRVLRLQLP